ncbi:hypothetical protein, partial [Mycobacteroides abscessus]|uniref:hypothetical protein n=1 Tax=Mycobacteroides abscessus TaxID=36809 RepID=UPI000A88E919
PNVPATRNAWWDGLSLVARPFDLLRTRDPEHHNQPWGPAGDKIADEFANGEDGFIKVRDTIVGIAKNDLKPALDDVGSELTKSADSYVRQTNSIREH